MLPDQGLQVGGVVLCCMTRMSGSPVLHDPAHNETLFPIVFFILFLFRSHIVSSIIAYFWIMLTIQIGCVLGHMASNICEYLFRYQSRTYAGLFVVLICNILFAELNLSIIKRNKDQITVTNSEMI